MLVGVILGEGVGTRIGAGAEVGGGMGSWAIAGVAALFSISSCLKYSGGGTKMHSVLGALLSLPICISIPNFLN